MNRISVLVATALLVVACGAGANPTPTAGAATVKTATTSLGTVLVGGSNGKSLYAFLPDETAGKPTCNDPCSGTWPALTAAADFSVASGLDKTKFKLVARDDGSMQLQVNEYPLYFYAPDVNAGDVNGQGIGGKWFVVGQDGEPIGAPG